MHKFKINQNNKQPLCKWQDVKNLTTDHIESNYAVPCGKVNNITVVDLDFFYKLDDVDFFYKLPLSEPTKSIETGRKGYHLYYEYEPDLKTGLIFDHETETNLHIDIKK